MKNANKSPLFLDGWLEFNQIKWGVQPLRATYSTGNGEIPRAEVVYYLNNAGRIVQPRLNPYLPVVFESTPTQSMYRIYRQWLAVADNIVADMRVRGMHGRVELPPDVIDVRSWQWAGFRTEVRYTFFIDFPLDMQQVAKATRERIRKAQKSGYICQQTTNTAQVLACLQGTEERQGYEHGLTVQDLDQAHRLLGDEFLRMYICYAPNNEPASTRVCLHYPGGRAIGWLAGTKPEHLASGASQQLDHFSFEDLYAAGATGFDFVGANIPGIAAAKTGWGGQLVPSYTVEDFNVRSLAHWVYDRYRFMRTVRK